MPGEPKPQGSKSTFLIRTKTGAVVGANTTEANKGTKSWRADVKQFAQEAMGGRALFTGEVLVQYHFIMRRPLSTPKSKATPPAVKKPDLDKLCRAIGDALKGTVYADDSLITTIYATKRIAELGEPTGVQIVVFDEQNTSPVT